MRRTLLLIPLLLAGCVGGTPSATSSSPPAGGFDPTRFAKCMRENGIPDFPDPEVGSNGGVRIRMPDGVPEETVEKATKACREFSPDGGNRGKPDPAFTAKLRELSKCMRANGVPEFPDPSADGGIQLKREKDGSGIDPESPEFKKAEEACKQFRPEPPGKTKDGGA